MPHLLLIEPRPNSSTPASIETASVSADSLSTATPEIFDDVVAAALIANTDHVLGDREVQALALCAASKLPIFVVVCCPGIDEDDTVRLIEYAQATLSLSGLVAQVVSADAERPLSFWDRLSLDERDLLIQRGIDRTAQDLRQRRNQVISEQIAEITRTLQEYARIRLECDAISQRYARKREAIDRLRQAALHDINTTSLSGRVSLQIEEAARGHKESKDIAQAIEQRLESFLTTWSDSIVETFLEGLHRDADLVLRVPTDSATPHVSFEVNVARTPSTAKILRNGAAGLSLASFAGIIGLSIPPLIIVPAILGLGSYFALSQHSEETRQAVLRASQPYVSEACAKYSTFARNLITRLCGLADSKALSLEQSLHAQLLAMPHAMSDDEAAVLAKERARLIALCSI